MTHRPLVPSNIERLSPYVPGKPLSELAREFGVSDAVKLASNESPFGPSPKALAAATVAMASCNRYPDGHGLRSSVAAFHGVGIDEIILGNGSNELIDVICHTFAASGDHAVYPDPSFVCYRSSTIAANMDSTVVGLRAGTDYGVQDLIDAIRPDTKIIFVANPNNPTGTYLTGEDLKRLVRHAPAQAIVVIDEAYVEFADADDFVSAIDLRSEHPQLLILRTFSKAYGLAGFRVGYAVGNPRIIGYMDRIRPPFNVNNLALCAAEAALADREHLQTYLEHNRSERARVTAALTEMGLAVVPSQANFVLVDVAREGRSVYEALLQRGVIVRPMAGPIQNYLRVTLGLGVENDRMLAALRAVLTT